MKITELKVIPTGYTKDMPQIPRSFALIRIATDEDVIGWGEASSAYGHSYPLVIKQIVEGPLTRAILGKDPLEIEARLADMRRYIAQFLGTEGASSQAIGAIEIALWDILGKVSGQPIYRLLGGRRTAVPVYGTGATYFEQSGEWHAHFFDPCLARGFKGVKVRVGKSPEWDLEMVRMVRNHIGYDVELFIDAFMTYTTTTAVAMAKQFQEYRPGFLEEPVAQDDIGGLEQVARLSAIPIAVGERIYSARGFARIIEKNAAHILQPDSTIMGGLLEARKVCFLGELHGLRVIPHIGGLSAVGLAANLHLACSSQAVSMLELDVGHYQPLRDEILKDPLFGLDRVKDGMLAVPQGPGLGIDIDEEALERFSYSEGAVYPDIYPQYGAGTV